MRKREKIQRRNRVIIGFLMIIFMVSSAGSIILYYGNSSDADTIKFSAKGTEYTFVPKQDSNGNFFYDVSGGEDSFRAYYTPDQVQLDIEEEAKTYLKQIPYFYLSFEPNSRDVAYSDFLRFDIRQNSGGEKFFIDAVVEESAQYDLPVITCKNASSQSPVVILKNANLTSVDYEDYCVNVEYANPDVLRVRDMIVFLMRGFEI